jgi:very-short-patch-repair endonuclease
MKKYKIKIKTDFKDQEDVLKYQRYLAYSNPTLVQTSKFYLNKLTLSETPAEIHIKKLLNEIGVEYEFQKVIFVPKSEFFILDIYLPQLHLYIELDGSHHYTDEGMLKDTKRFKKLMSVGFNKELRFSNNMALSFDVEDLKKILEAYSLTC